MRNNKLRVKLLLTMFLALAAPIVNGEGDAYSKEINIIRSELQQIINVNLQHQEKFHDIVTESMLVKQTPYATIVLCSDSRVDMNSINNTPAGQLFTVRNIGNQVKTAYGTVEYGVNYIHTPMLIIVGHSACGAVKAAMSNYRAESAYLRQELGNLEVDPKDSLANNIVRNVNNQVKLAVADFSNKVAKKDVVVIGLVYDMHNEFKYGSGRIILVNINNSTDPQELRESQYVKGLENLVILGLNAKP